MSVHNGLADMRLQYGLDLRSVQRLDWSPRHDLHCSNLLAYRAFWNGSLPDLGPARRLQDVIGYRNGLEGSDSARLLS
jgi:hypothetical protein